MTAQPSPVGSRMEAPTSARIVHAGGPRNGTEDVLEVPGGIPTVFAVDEPVGLYLRDKLLPDGRWRMRWRGFE